MKRKRTSYTGKEKVAAGVQHLRPFTKLKNLILHECNLTPEGEAEFRRMHPDSNLDIQRR